jgi:hypothetical protein
MRLCGHASRNRQALGAPSPVVDAAAQPASLGARGELPVTMTEPAYGPSPELLMSLALLMSKTAVTQRRSDPPESTTPMARMDAALHLSPQTISWLADHSQARRFVCSVWDKLDELDRSGQYPAAITALRRVLAQHQPTSAGRCRTCRRVAGRRRPFPCIVWHQVRCDLLGLFAGAGRQQPAGHGSDTVFPR